ncbi:catalase [Rhabdaerophilum sp. SD176]|uniref:catalase n=1 Tax=Rhabdaerophilum sp. SD176 TaxID=2983548 RepID=UPI0024DF9EBF|nr:catalase [Rhabdaerophilum sp. SD176]
MPFLHTARLPALALLGLAMPALPAMAQSPSTTESIVESMRTLSGKQKARPSGAKGQCFTARFTPTPEARALTKSAAFAKESAAIVRFSVGGGNPKVADATKTVNRGLSLRIDPNGPGQSEFVMVNAPVNFVKSPEQMLAFLQARLPGADGKPDAARIKAFTDANPETTNQGKFLAGRPVPASWVGVSYWAIHPYTFTNAQGAKQVVKFRFAPQGGEAGLTDDEAKAKPADFLAAELTGRIAAKQPAGFDVLAVLGTAEDAKLPATQQWPDEDKRPSVRVATLTIAGLEKNETCDGQFFDPTNLADGLAGPTDDPLFTQRQPAYAISITQRF